MINATVPLSLRTLRCRPNFCVSKLTRLLKVFSFNGGSVLWGVAQKRRLVFV